MITADIEIEDLVRQYPFSVRYLMEKGIRCIACGEPVWGSLRDAATEKGYDESQLMQFVSEMNALAAAGS